VVLGMQGIKDSDVSIHLIISVFLLVGTT
jgi:hypothetical protein